MLCDLIYRMEQDKLINGLLSDKLINGLLSDNYYNLNILCTYNCNN